MRTCLDENGRFGGKESQGLMTEDMKAMRTTEFKDFCSEKLGSASIEFQIHECERICSAVSEAAAIKKSNETKGITHEAIGSIK